MVAVLLSEYARSEEVRQQFYEFGETLTELLKLGALLLLGALISPRLLAEFGVGTYVFVVLVLLAARPLAISIALFGSSIGWPQ